MPSSPAFFSPCIQDTQESMLTGFTEMEEDYADLVEERSQFKVHPLAFCPASYIPCLSIPSFCAIVVSLMFVLSNFGFSCIIIKERL